MRSLLFLLSVCCVAGCAADVEDDPTMNMTGTEELAVRVDEGTYVCESPHKVLLCHIPPGNPDNAHTICVGAPAVRAHQEHHGDPLGACDDGGSDDGSGSDDGGSDDGDGSGDGSDGGGPDAGQPEPEPDGGVVVD